MGAAGKQKENLYRIIPFWEENLHGESERETTENEKHGFASGRELADREEAWLQVAEAG